ncbi:MAG: hypothetical protein H6Q67_2303 [Firmicutes bacterium]|nr:hypothetical protein [Bacillota bacterium]
MLYENKTWKTVKLWGKSSLTPQRPIRCIVKITYNREANNVYMGMQYN